MEEKHPEDYTKYFDKLEDIIASPNYVAKHPRHGSLPYIRVFEGHVMVGVRLSKSGAWYARTLFTMSDEKVARYLAKGTMKPY